MLTHLKLFCRFSSNFRDQHLQMFLIILKKRLIWSVQKLLTGSRHFFKILILFWQINRIFHILYITYLAVLSLCVHKSFSMRMCLQYGRSSGWPPASLPSTSSSSLHWPWWRCTGTSSWTTTWTSQTSSNSLTVSEQKKLTRKRSMRMPGLWITALC